MSGSSINITNIIIDSNGNYRNDHAYNEAVIRVSFKIFTNLKDNERKPVTSFNSCLTDCSGRLLCVLYLIKH